MNKIFFIAAALLCFSAGAAEQWLDGRIVGVTDGDTVTLLDADLRQHEIRLAGIDAPETSCHARKPSHLDEQCVERSQPFGHTAKKNLTKLVYGKDVRLLLQQEGNKNGSSYGRKIGTIFVDGVDANLDQVQHGLAWHYTKYAKRYQSPESFRTYAVAERNAQENKSGLWNNENSIPPWDYRNSRKNN